MDKKTRTYIVVGITAAVASAMTVGFVFWNRTRQMEASVSSVEDLLDRCHDQVDALENRLGDYVATIAA
jgi:hypothetical protein